MDKTISNTKIYLSRVYSAVAEQGDCYDFTFRLYDQAVFPLDMTFLRDSLIYKKYENISYDYDNLYFTVPREI